jgi:CheY-like chemotaxis protein
MRFSDYKVLILLYTCGSIVLIARQKELANTALIIDDEFAIRAIYETVLERLGFDAIHAADGEAALELLEYHQPNLILLDILMPKIDGIEVFQRIQAMPHLDHVAVVIITAHERFRGQLDLSAKDSFLVKPVRPHQIAQVAEGLLTVP